MLTFDDDEMHYPAMTVVVIVDLLVLLVTKFDGQIEPANFGADSAGLRYDFHDAFVQDQLRNFTQNLTNHRIILPDMCHFPE